MEPSIVETFTFLERTKGCARAWSLSQPEHEEALDKFITDLDQIALELKNSVSVKARFRSARNGSMMEWNLFEIVNCLVPVITFAEIISERQPEYTVPLKRFQGAVCRLLFLPPALLRSAATCMSVIVHPRIHCATL